MKTTCALLAVISILGTASLARAQIRPEMGNLRGQPKPDARARRVSSQPNVAFPAVPTVDIGALAPHYQAPPALSIKRPESPSWLAWLLGPAGLMAIVHALGHSLRELGRNKDASP